MGMKSQRPRRLQDADISAYEGLVFSTARRYAGILDEDPEDIEQILRLKVAQAMVSYDPTKTKLPERNYVFACMRNRVKDLLKGQSRRNDARGGSEVRIEDAAHPDDFECRYLATTEDEVYAAVHDEAITLPSSLTSEERDVVVLLAQGFSHHEMARMLGTRRQRVHEIHESVQLKMADWRPSAHVIEPTPQLLAA